MAKTSAHPGLRVHRWRDKAGNVLEAYYYDMRQHKKPDLPLGRDKDAAIKRWAELRNGGAAEVARTAHRRARLAPLEPKTRRKFDPSPWAGLPAWAKPMYLGAERRSVAAGRVELLTVGDFREVVLRADGRCELTGIALDQTKGGRGPFRPSIDRKDSRFGYVAGNVRIVCLLANQALSEWGEAPVMQFAAALMSAGRCGSGSVFSGSAEI